MKQLLALLFLCPVVALAAELTFDATEQSIDAGLETLQVTAEFPFKNTSNSTVTIDHYDSGCSCLGVEIAGKKLTYAPGETGMLRGHFEVGTFTGTVEKMIAVWLKGDAEDEPTHRLTVSVRVPVLVEIEPKTVSWNAGEKATTKVVSLTFLQSPPPTILKVTSSSPEYTHELKIVKPGHVELRITPKTTDTKSLAIFRIETDINSERHRTLQAFAVVR